MQLTHAMGDGEDSSILETLPYTQALVPIIIPFLEALTYRELDSGIGLNVNRGSRFINNKNFRRS
jgi:hypothetical protein